MAFKDDVWYYYRYLLKEYDVSNNQRFVLDILHNQPSNDERVFDKFAKISISDELSYLKEFIYGVGFDYVVFNLRSGFPFVYALKDIDFYERDGEFYGYSYVRSSWMRTMNRTNFGKKIYKNVLNSYADKTVLSNVATSKKVLYVDASFKSIPSSFMFLMYVQILDNLSSNKNDLYNIYVGTKDTHSIMIYTPLDAYKQILYTTNSNFDNPCNLVKSLNLEYALPKSIYVLDGAFLKSHYYVFKELAFAEQSVVVFYNPLLSVDKASYVDDVLFIPKIEIKNNKLYVLPYED